MIQLLALSVGLAHAAPWSMEFSDGDDLFDDDSPMNRAAIAFISGATSSVEVAIYNLTDLGPGSSSVTDALIARRQALGPGSVRVIVDSDNYNSSAVNALLSAGVLVADDNNDSDEMHNKFIVVDAVRVWTSTGNFTDPGFSSQENVAIEIDDAAVAGAYRAEFNEMWSGVFKEASPPTPNSEFTLDGRPLRVLFAAEDDPIDDTSRGLRFYVRWATESVSFLSYVFTGEINDAFGDLSDDLVDVWQNGVEVRGVLDHDLALGNPPYESDGSGPQMDELGMDVRLDGHADVMHAKLAVIDQRVLVLGSANFTYSADTYNDENMVFYENPAAARRALRYINYVYDGSVEEGNAPISPDRTRPVPTTAVTLSDGPGSGTATVTWNTGGESDLSLAHVFVANSPINAASIAYDGVFDPVASVAAGTGTVVVDRLSDGSDLRDGIDLYAAVVVTDRTGNESVLGAGSTDGPVQTDGSGALLLGPTPGDAGAFNLWTLTGASPSTKAYLFYSLSPGTVAVPNCPGVTLSLGSPVLLGAQNTDVNGGTVWGFNVPQQVQGRTAYFQVAQPSTCVISNRTSVVFQ